MIEVNLEVPENANTDVVIDSVERVCLQHQLSYTLKGSLASYPGSVHWHFKAGKQKGTLEITWWENKNRLWCKVADGRKDKWIEESLPQIKEEIELITSQFISEANRWSSRRW
jgi:hypothetical protein